MNIFAEWLLIVHIAATMYMTGIIWFVQVVHYPLFAQIDRASFSAYERQHTARTGYVVGPAMLLEGVTNVALLFIRPANLAAWPAWLGLALLAVIWFSTAFVQIPCHNALSQSFDASTHRRLVRSNLIRTIAWSARSVLVLSWS